MRFLLSAAAGAGGAFLFLACSDSGSTFFGANYGDLPNYDAGADVVLTDGAAVVEISDGSTDGPKPGCTTGTVAVASGQGGVLNASVDKGRGFAVANLQGTAADSAPAIMAYGGGFVIVSRAGENLTWSNYKTGWSPPAILSALGASVGAPTLTQDATLGWVVFPSGQNRHFYRAQYNGNGFGAGVSVESDATHYSFGTESAGFAWTGQDFAWLENGTDKGLYSRSNGTAWTPGVAVSGAGTLGTDNLFATPQIVAIEGATYDAIGLFIGGAFSQANHLGWVRRKKSDRTWSTATSPLLDATLSVTERPNVGRTVGGDVLVTFRDGTGKGYVVRGALSDADGVTWGAASAFGAGEPITVQAPPAVARGVCGDDAIVAFASQGHVQLSRLRGTAWSAPETIDGASGSFVAIATSGQ